MRNMLMVEPRPVRLLKGGGSILRGDKHIGKTEKGQQWMAHSIYWEEKGPPMLWMLDSANEGVGAWAALRDTEGGGAEVALRRAR